MKYLLLCLLLVGCGSGVDSSSGASTKTVEPIVVDKSKEECHAVTVESKLGGEDWSYIICYVPYEAPKPHPLAQEFLDFIE